MTHTRRDFLRAGLAGIAGAALPRPSHAAAWQGEDARIRRIGLQLYTMRAEMIRQFDGVLGWVAAAGYEEVEFAGYFGRTPAQVHESLKEAGLRAPATHVDLPEDPARWGALFDSAKTIGHRYVVVAWMPVEQRRTLDDWKRLAERFNRAGEAARRVGLRFAYHNHDYEFRPIGGTVPYDLLLAETDPELVRLEMDIYWIVSAGADPLAYFARYPKRFPMVHVKDRTADGTMVDVGRGTIDWRRILSRRKQAGIEHFFVEHDEPADPFASAQAGAAYLKRLRL